MNNRFFAFKEITIPVDMVNDLRRMNPWWEGKPIPPLPSTRRHLVELMKSRMRKGLAPIVAVRGPRQIGKTVAQMQFISDLIDEGIQPTHILHVQFDELKALASQEFTEPLLRIVDWYEQTILEATLNEIAHQGKKTYLFFDEVQNLDAWAPQLKMLVDHSATNVLITDSSALRIALGRDSLAGRITTIEAGVLSITEIARFWGMNLGKPFWAENGLESIARKDFWLDLREHGKKIATERDYAFNRFSERGGYPLAHRAKEISWEHIADQLNETVVRRVIQHDLRLGERGRKRDAPLLEEVFRLACRYAGQSPNLQTLARETKRALQANVGPQRVHHYLRFLGDTLLLRLIEPLEIRLKKKRGAPKICLADHSLRAAWLQEIIPLAPQEIANRPHLSVLAGHIAESVVGATLSTISGLDIAHFPERNDEPEVDFVLTVGAKRVPVEVKYQRKVDNFSDTEGLRSFIEKTVNNAPFCLLITQIDQSHIDDPRIISIPLSSLMLLR